MNKIINIIVLKLGWVISKLSVLVAICRNDQFSRNFMGKAHIQYPYVIQGLENIKCGESVNIGVGATLFCTRAKLVFKGHFVSGPHLTIITGDHMPLLGKYLDEVTDLDKDRHDINHQYDKDVIIEEDVWAGANVTILKGVTIGRGCIIAAGAVVTHSMPPYSIVGGVPAKVLKKRWNDDQIREHELKCYPELTMSIHNCDEEN